MVTITNQKTHLGLIALFLMALLFSFEAAAQNEVSIGSATTKSNAILWLNGNGSQGLILPVVTNKSAVSNPDKGMIVYDDSDNKVWYRSNSAWVEVGSGTGSSTNNLNLLLQGNQLQLRDGTTVQNTVNIAGGTQSNGSFLVFTGGSWQYATLSGDVTGANAALVVNGIKGKTVATLPATPQALVYDPAANSGSGGWIFQTLTSGGTVTNITGTAPVTVTSPTTTPTISIANGGITNTLLATDAVNASKIQDATITGADIAATTITGGNISATTITADKLAQSAATTGQVLKWNGTNWVPQNDDAGTGTVATLSNGQLLTGNGTTNSATTLTGDATLSGGVITIGNNAVTTAKINAAAVDATKLADNAVTSAKISDATITNADIANGTITASKLAQSGANNNEVLQWNGTNWVPVALSSGGTVTQINTSNGLTGGPITNSGTISIASSGVGSTELADNAVVTNKISDNSVTTSKINNSAVDNTKLADNAVTSLKISDGSITGADIAGTTITADKLAQSSATSGQVLKWNGTNWVPQNDDAGVGVTPTLNNGQILVGNGSTNSAVALSGDATLSGGAITIGNNAITTAKINTNAVDATKLADNAVTAAKISDGSITGADLASNIAISTTGNVSVNAPGVISGIGSGLTTLNASNISSGSLALARITPGTNGQVLTTVAGVPAWQTSGAGATTLDGLTDATVTAASSGQLLVNDGAGQFRNVSASGDATISNSGAVTLTNSAATRTNLGLGTLATLSAIDLTSGNVTGILPVANGGTGRSSWDGLLFGSAGTLSDISTGTAGQFLRVVGTSPSWQTFAVTSTDITDGTITNVDINGSAAIAGTKVNPTFGTQNISTSGTLSAGSTTVSGLTIGTSVWPANASGALTNDGTGSLTWAASGGSSGWGLTGNAGIDPSTNFIGTTNNVGLRFKTNGNNSGLIDPLSSNNFFGYLAGNVTTGTQNVAMGTNSLLANTTGGGNVAVGTGALQTNITGSNNIAIGNFADVGASGLTNAIAIGKNAIAGASNTLALGGIGSDAVKVGIGTTTPASKLDVSGDLRLAQITAPATPADKLYNVAGSLFWNGTNISSGGSGWGLTGNAGTNPAANFIGTTDAQPLRFSTGAGGTERMRISATGNVGIGTNNPESKLEIQGGDLILSGSPGTTTTETDPPDINFVTLDNAFKAKIWTAQTTNTLWISTSTDPTNNRHLTLDPSGNFGIGTTAALAAKLEVNGYTKLGSSAPLIQMAKLTGTTSASAGGTAVVSLGAISSAKIISIDVMVEWSAGQYVPPRYNGNGTLLDFTWYSTTTDIRIVLDAGATNITSKPIKILVTYEQ